MQEAMLFIMFIIFGIIIACIGKYADTSDAWGKYSDSQMRCFYSKGQKRYCEEPYLISKGRLCFFTDPNGNNKLCPAMKEKCTYRHCNRRAQPDNALCVRCDGIEEDAKREEE